MAKPGGDTDLQDRIRAACNPISGLTPAQYERHVYQIVKVVRKAKQGTIRHARARWHEQWTE